MTDKKARQLAEALEAEGLKVSMLGHGNAEDDANIAKWESKREESTSQKKFKEDMEEAGYTVRFYSGRSRYEGWATAVDDRSELQDVIRATGVKVQWDELGLGLIIYPMRA